ncbi:hypothetical protein BH23PLA1_BH23PLA1_20390 [soil metagenome]
MIPINWRPDRSTLAGFSEAWMFFLGMVAAPLSLFRDRPILAATFWTLAVVGRLVGLVRPWWMRPVYLGLTLATRPIGWTISQLVLAIVYYGVVTPIGLALRWAGYDPLRRRLETDAESYWEPYNPDRGTERYLRPF